MNTRGISISEGVMNSRLFPVLMSTQVPPLLPQPVQGSQGYNLQFGIAHCPIHAVSGTHSWATRVTSSPTFNEYAHLEMEGHVGHNGNRGNHQESYNHRTFARDPKLNFS